jgi:hypothetical protein
VDHVNLTAELVVFVRGQAQRRAGTFPVTVRQTEPTGAHDRPPGRTGAVEEDDHTEASVQSRLAAQLIAGGWQIRRMADTLNREHGIDLIAVKQGRILAVGVKGFPSRFYANPRRGGQIKPTNPSVQARHWYATAVLKSLLTHDEHPTTRWLWHSRMLSSTATCISARAEAYKPCRSERTSSISTATSPPTDDLHDHPRSRF